MRMRNELFIGAPPQRIFDYASRTQNWPDILPHYRYVRVLESSGPRSVVEMAARRAFGALPLAIPVRWRAEQTNDAALPGITFRHVGGWTKGMRVWWRFVPRNGGTQVQIDHEWRSPLATFIGKYFVDPIATRTLACMKRRLRELVNHRVAVTGLGMITPLGIGAEELWQGVLSRRVAVAPLTRFDAGEFPSRIAAQIDDFDPAAFLARRRIQWTDRFSQLALAAARLAVDDAAFPVGDRRNETGVFTGSALGGVALAEEQMNVFAAQGLRAVHPLLAISVFGGAAASNVAIEFGITGPATANANSCAAGAMAIGDAFRAVRRGEVRAALAGGVEAPLAPLTYGAFTVARAMSARNDDPQRASRPFDEARDGFVMAEGAGMLMLERYDEARARGARIYGEIAGYGASNDAFHMSAPLADGEQTAAAMHRALDDACVHPDEVEAINAHGSSTKLGDAAEARAYRRVFGERLASIPVCATKGQHGHALGATGAWEMAIALLSMRDEVIPGAVNLEQRDGACGVDCRNTERCIASRVVLSNSSGFGGLNAAVVLRRFDS